MAGLAGVAGVAGAAAGSGVDPAGVAAGGGVDPVGMAGVAGVAPLELSDVWIERSTASGTAPTRVGPVTFSVAAGEYVALVGPSGAGKSSVVAAALGFIAPSSGVLNVRGHVAWAGQRPGLIQGSVLDNVALGAEHADQALAREVLDELGLSGIELDYALGALGAGLSGGQSQRVAVARALYRARSTRATLLLLDEPSSALDATSEQLVIKAAREEAKRGVAVLVVSHRQAMIDEADRVIHLYPTRSAHALAATQPSEARS